MHMAIRDVNFLCCMPVARDWLSCKQNSQDAASSDAM